MFILPDKLKLNIIRRWRYYGFYELYNWKCFNTNTSFIYLGKNDSSDNYVEVGREIWKHFIEDKPTDFDILSEKISDNNSMIINLEELLLDTDFRLMCLEIEKEYEEM